jgi:hypothetical protein
LIGGGSTNKPLMFRVILIALLLLGAGALPLFAAATIV